MIEERATTAPPDAARTAGSPTPAFPEAVSAARDELAMICAQLNDGHTRLVALMRRVLADELWCGVGFRSPEHWLTAYAGLTWSSAHDVVRIAERCSDLPTMQRLLDAGRLTLGLAAVIAKHTPSAYDADVAEFASYTTVTQLRRTLCRYEFETGADGNAADSDSNSDDSDDSDDSADSADSADAQDAGSSSALLAGAAADDEALVDAATDAAQARTPSRHDPTTTPPRLEMRYAAGRFLLSYDAPADIGALVEQSLLEAKDALFRLATGTTADAGSATSRPSAPCGDNPGSASRTHRGASFGEAMSLLAQRSLDTGAPLGHSRASRYRVYLHLDTQGAGWLHKQCALPSTLRARILCDGVIQPVWETEGTPVSVGRAQRIVPARTRRLLEDRDRGCRFPGCLAMHHLECHHLDHWIDGGLTDADRLIMLCPFHHDEHHRGTFVMVGDPTRPDGVTFTARDGTRLRPLYQLYDPPCGLRSEPRHDRRRGPDRPSQHDPRGNHATPHFAPYAGATNETLHLSLVRFDPRPPAASPRSGASPGEQRPGDQDPPWARSQVTKTPVGEIPGDQDPRGRDPG
ncbi:HNH endonuclease signature motif containing protein [Flexivirga lutea]